MALNEIRKSFIKDATKLSSISQHQLAETINLIASIVQLSELMNCKKLKGFTNASRIRLGQYRIGFYYENETIELVRILARKDIYRYFP